MAHLTLPHSVILRRRARSGEDRYHSEKLGRRDDIAARARIDFLTSDEDVLNRESSTRAATMILAPKGEDAGKTASDLASYDEVEWPAEGLVFKLDGPATPVHDGLGRRNHFEAIGSVVTR